MNTPQESSRLSKRVLAVVVVVVAVGAAIALFARRGETPQSETAAAPASTEQAAAPSEKAAPDTPPAQAADQAEAPAEEAKPTEQAETPAKAGGEAEGAAGAATAATAATAAGAAAATEGAEAAAAGGQPAAAPMRETLRSGEEPDWPCPQRYTAELSPGAIWTGPPIDEALKTWQNDAAVRDVAVEIASDTTEEKEGVKMIDDLAPKLGADKDTKLTELFAGIFDSMNTQRSNMLRGIKRFVKRQETVAQKISDLQAQQQELQAKGVQPIPEGEVGVTPTDNEDVAKMKTLTEQIYWNNRVYDERNKLTPYVCDEPIMLESRLGAYARAIEAHLSK